MQSFKSASSFAVEEFFEDLKIQFILAEEWETRFAHLPKSSKNIMPHEKYYENVDRLSRSILLRFRTVIMPPNQTHGHAHIYKKNVQEMEANEISELIRKF